MNKHIAIILAALVGTIAQETVNTNKVEVPKEVSASTNKVEVPKLEGPVVTNLVPINFDEVNLTPFPNDKAKTFWATNVTSLDGNQLYIITVTTTNRMLFIIHNGSTNYLKGEDLGSVTNIVPVHLEYKK